MEVWNECQHSLIVFPRSCPVCPSAATETVETAFLQDMSVWLHDILKPAAAPPTYSKNKSEGFCGFMSALYANFKILNLFF